MKQNKKFVQFLSPYFVLTAVVLFCFISSALAGELLVYSSTDADNLKYYMEEFQKDNPDIKVNVVRESTGTCLLYTSPSPRDKRQCRMPSSA
mgnify:CR=1 FL=1